MQLSPKVFLPLSTDCLCPRSHSDLAVLHIFFQSDPSCGVSKPVGGAWRWSCSGSECWLPAVF